MRRCLQDCHLYIFESIEYYISCVYGNGTHSDNEVAIYTMDVRRREVREREREREREVEVERVGADEGAILNKL